MAFTRRNGFHQKECTNQKVSVFGVILVRIVVAFSCIRTEYGEILRVSPHSVRMRENEGRMRTRITPNTVTFYAVLLIFRNYGFHFNQGNSKWPRGFAGKKTGCSFPRWFIIRYFIYINFKIKVLSFLLISSA